jgi:AcrR family transcriptional regulator
MSEQQRDRILAEACALFLRDGLEGFSMRRLARAVGVTAPALYRHYDGKEAVLHDVVREAYERMAQHLYRALQGRSPSERLSMAALGYLDFALEHPRLYDALFASPELVGLGDLPEEVEMQGCAVGQFWNDRIRECMDAGLIRRSDPADVGLTLWAHAHGLISLYARGLLSFPVPLTDAEFRQVFRESGRRVLMGLAGPALSPAGLDDADGDEGGRGAGEGALTPGPRSRNGGEGEPDEPDEPDDGAGAAA